MGESLEAAKLHTRCVRQFVRMEKGAAYTGRLPRGCVLCQKGAKMVLLVTGRCARRCCYCPLSKEKRGKDVFYANERRIGSIAEMLDEARLMKALGTGMTGGDPLEAIDRSVDSIKALKQAFGSRHHIHLYTSTTKERRIERVARAGLDEIRFHPPMGEWKRLGGSVYAKAIALSKDSGMSAGLEIPVIPGRRKELEAAITFADSAGLDFVNLNELEFSETNWRSLRTLGFDVKTDVSSAVMGSESLGRSLLRMDVAVPLHYCSSSFKDGIQLRRRILRRGRNVRKPHEILTEDGTLVKGVIETEDLQSQADLLRRCFGVPKRLVWIDTEKGRLEVAPWVLEEVACELEEPSYIVEEYPTADRLEVERRPLKRR